VIYFLKAQLLKDKHIEETLITLSNGFEELRK